MRRQAWADGRREQTTGTKFHKILKNVNIFEFHDHIWNHRKKCIQKSANIDGISSLIREIDVEKVWESKSIFAQENQGPRSKRWLRVSIRSLPDLNWLVLQV